MTAALEGKIGVVFGVANQRSIAWAIAQAQVTKQQTMLAQQQSSISELKAALAQQQKQIASLNAGLQKMGAQVGANEAARRVALSNH